MSRSRPSYCDLAAECREAGWRAVTYPVDVWCQGFVGSSTSRLLCNMGATWARRWKFIRELSEEAEGASIWLWLRRKAKYGGPDTT